MLLCILFLSEYVTLSVRIASPAPVSNTTLPSWTDATVVAISVQFAINAFVCCGTFVLFARSGIGLWSQSAKKNRASERKLLMIFYCGPFLALIICDIILFNESAIRGLEAGVSNFLALIF